MTALLAVSPTFTWPEVAMVVGLLILAVISIGTAMAMRDDAILHEEAQRRRDERQRSSRQRRPVVVADTYSAGVRYVRDHDLPDMSTIVTRPDSLVGLRDVELYRAYTNGEGSPSMWERLNALDHEAATLVAMGVAHWGAL